MNKTKYLLGILISSTINLTYSQAHNPLLVAVLMIKDEAHIIEKTVTPLYEGGITNFFVLDTGSNDGTQDVLKKFFKKNKINGILKEEKFVDFATSRNRALELAEKEFPNAAFMLMLDANWHVHGVDQLLNFCREHVYDDKPSYLIRVINYANGNVTGSLKPRLFKTVDHVRYIGPVHEYIEPQKNSLFAISTPCYIDQIPNEKKQQESTEKILKNEQLLLKEYDKNPGDAHTLFYLAQTYANLGEFKKAYDYLKLRIAINGNAEENYLALYRLGLITRLLWQSDASHNWQEALDYLLFAHSMRPQRAEPLIRIAQHYLTENNRAIAYLFARRAIEMPIPVNETELVELDLYNYTRFDLMSTCAWNVGALDLGEGATREALKLNPEAKHLQDNLNLYISAKTELAKSIQEQQEKQTPLA